ncbi:hypothetical protein FBU59_000730 [Linderina macrospora]|uniref:Uncharacterized protein n=1 Tax=Linderina macrospora TaxID=4868 RepID=A0ACC1JFY3_9FUNG|nr:hypothetical protein FBU59_000730 [Linderina macrospora]
MGLMKKIKKSYVFTHMEVGKYTKRRTNSSQTMDVECTSGGVVTTEFISEFDEPRPTTAVRAMTAPTWSSNSLQHADRSPASSQATAVSSPPTPTNTQNTGEFPEPRRRPKPARAARSAVDMQSVYFAPGRNINTPNSTNSLYPGDKPQFDKNSASSMDYYVFTPTRRDVSATMPLDERKRHRATVKAEQATSSLHKHELAAEASTPASLPTNPFVARRKQAQQMTSQGWNAANPFDDPIINSGRGGDRSGLDPNDPRKYLNTPVYANQAGNTGLDLLA